MGRITALGLQDPILKLTLTEQIRMHLQGNHYPPVSKVFVPLCVKAIRFANRGAGEHKLRLPEGYKTRDGKRLTTVSHVIEVYHLDSWLKEAE